MPERGGAPPVAPLRSTFLGVYRHKLPWGVPSNHSTAIPRQRHSASPFVRHVPWVVLVSGSASGASLGGGQGLRGLPARWVHRPRGELGSFRARSGRGVWVGRGACQCTWFEGKAYGVEIDTDWDSVILFTSKNVHLRSLLGSTGMQPRRRKAGPQARWLK